MTTHLPQVSIIINCFNGEAFLAEALSSVLSQTFSQWELIFWDNQSTDSSSLIFHKYSDLRFRYFYAPSFTTLAEARFLAIQVCRAPWVCFIDCDDIWMPNKLELQINAIASSSKSNIGLVFGFSRYFGLPLHLSSPFHNNNKYLYPPCSYNSSIYTNPFVLSYRNIVGFCSALYKKEFIQDYSQVIKFDLIPDYFWALYLFIVSDVIFIDSTLCSIRLHSANLSSQRRLDMFQQSLDVLRHICSSFPGSYSEFPALLKLFAARLFIQRKLFPIPMPFFSPIQLAYHLLFITYFYFIYKIRLNFCR